MPPDTTRKQLYSVTGFGACITALRRFITVIFLTPFFGFCFRINDIAFRIPLKISFMTFCCRFFLMLRSKVLEYTEYYCGFRLVKNRRRQSALCPVFQRTHYSFMIRRSIKHLIGKLTYLFISALYSSGSTASPVPIIEKITVASFSL